MTDRGGSTLFSALPDSCIIESDPVAAGSFIRDFHPSWTLIIDTPSALPICRDALQEGRLVYEVHTPYPEGHAILSTRGFAESIDAILVPSHSQAGVVLDLVESPVPVAIVPNGLSAVPNGTLAPDPWARAGVPLLGWVGRLDSLKNWTSLLEIADEISAKRPVGAWIVGGEGSPQNKKDQLEEWVQSRDTEAFRWSPAIPHHEMPAYYRAIAASGGCLVSTSWAESFGLATLEAMDAGCPVVCPDVVGLCDLVRHESNGLIYTAGDLAGAAAAVQRLLDDPMLREQLVVNARRSAGQFTIARSVDALLDAMSAIERGETAALPDTPTEARTVRRAYAAAAAEWLDDLQERDELILSLQRELHEKVGERDERITGLQSELQEKISERDSRISLLQGEMQHKVGEANAAIEDLQRQLGSAAAKTSEVHRELMTAIEERDARILALNGELHEKVEERDRIIAGLQQELHTKVGEANAVIEELNRKQEESTASFRRELESRDAALHQVESEFRRTVAEHNRITASLLERLEKESRQWTSVHEEQNARIKTLARTIEQSESELRRLEAKAHELEEELRQERERESDAAGAVLSRLAGILPPGDGSDAAESETLEQLAARIEQALAARDATSAELRRRIESYQSYMVGARAQLDGILTSRLWKAGLFYWRTLQSLGLRSMRRNPIFTEPLPPIYCSHCGERMLVHGLAAEARLQIAPRTTGGSNVLAFPTERPLLQDSERRERENAYDIVCFPIIDWDFRFQRPQQLMAQFAAAGHRVFYISQQFRESGEPFALRELRKGVWEVSLRVPRRDVYTGQLTAGDTQLFFDAIDALRKEVSLGATISMLQLPFWYPIAARARERLGWPIVYDCMDHHAGFSTGNTAAVRQERALMRAADLVIVSSAFLEREARKENDNVVLARNGCDYEHFAGIPEKPKGERHVIGYYGAIADWFDSKLVAELAEMHPEWDFLLVGSTYLADVQRLSKLPNVELAGEKPYEEIPAWLARFDVAMIPFKRIPLTEATNPVKVYEMMAGGKPIVSVPIPEVAALAPLVRLASTPKEFSSHIRDALKDDDPDSMERRRRFAARNNWASRYRVIAGEARRTFPRASIIIVTYNNLEMNRMCLESLYATMDWPNFEVFVVDNASADGTPEYLRGIESSHSNLTVILNERNAGFAAANNQAMMLSSGDYIALLNNDTVLARGWLSSLIRHLHRDRRIGLIGPSTNAIGNEAMIDAGYSDVEAMPGWARNYTRVHQDELFEIPMLAMFCVAIRREVFEEIGPLDEQFGIGMFEDDDYALRVRAAGYRVVCARDAFVHHWMKAAFGKIPPDEYEQLFLRNRTLYEAKWGRAWKPHKRV
ncbi:MAG TPA: glycosyltransferase [Thermoanaerobaculia bacterium]|nr:glycosyltransferase [Thermoanaerobaculia bacterium]